MIIGLIGVKGSGKTTAAEYIESQIPNIKHVSFASRLKQVCSKITDQPIEYFEKQELKELEYKPRALSHFDIIKSLEMFRVDSFGSDFVNKFVGTEYTSNRQLLQILGTDILRSLDNDIHINTVLNRKGNLLISDVRFANEAEAIERAGGYLIYIRNEAAESVVTVDSHESEKQVMERARHKAHFVIKNEGKFLNAFTTDIDDVLFEINYYNQLEPQDGR